LTDFFSKGQQAVPFSLLRRTMSSLPLSNFVGPGSTPSPSLTLLFLGSKCRFAIAQQLVTIKNKCQTKAGNNMDDKSFGQQPEKYL
jgi:hypothetical protein